MGVWITRSAFYLPAVYIQHVWHEHATETYTYGNTARGDQLTAVVSTAIAYDAIGNPTTYNGYSLTWEGRQLHNGGNIMNKRRRRRRRNSFKRFFVKKPLWLTAFCLIVSMVVIAGIVWIIQDTHMYQKTLTTIEGPFNRYEVITDSYLVSTGFRTKKQGNIYIDEKKYIIASDSLKTFDSKNFTENVAVGEKIIVQITDNSVVYSIKDLEGTQYLALSEAQNNSANDNSTGMILCVFMLSFVWLFWILYDKN